MKYIGTSKCRFISKTHVIFDYVVRKCQYDNTENPIKAEGNVIINSKLEFDSDGRLSTNSTDNKYLIDRQVEEIGEKCKKRAKWIFAGMDNDIDNED